MIDTHIVVPEGIGMREAQTRVNSWSPGLDLYIVMAINCHQWLVHRVALPDHYRNAIEEHNARAGLQRGGMNSEIEPVRLVPTFR